MDMTGERRIPASRTVVWDALNDPATLKACIPGCERLEATGPRNMEATAAVKMGPVSARFNGSIELSDIDKPNSYKISGEGQGGVAGYARGGADVRLADDGPDATLLSYTVNAQVGGKIAQLGARLIDGTAKSIADQFFNNFTTELTRRHAPPAPGAPRFEAPTPAPAAALAAPADAGGMGRPLGVPIAWWVGGAAAALVLWRLLRSAAGN